MRALAQVAPGRRQSVRVRGVVVVARARGAGVVPELPEVETVRRGLETWLVGARLGAVAVRRRDLRSPIPADLEARLSGRVLDGVRRRAKYLLLDLDDGSAVLVHLGMSGRVLIHAAVGSAAVWSGCRPNPLGGVPPPDPFLFDKEGRHEHLRVATDRGLDLVYRDPRRFGLIDWLAPGQDAADARLAGLGPEPFDPVLTAAVFARRLANRRPAIKAALLDQAVIAGIGNIYACEALFMSGIDPWRPAGALTAAEAGRLLEALRAVLEAAIAAGGSSLRDYVQATGDSGHFQVQFAVYDREGQPCPGCDCDVSRTGGVMRLVQSGRSTFYCPRRQP